jgi:hypothetical protein
MTSLPKITSQAQYDDYKSSIKGISSERVLIAKQIRAIRALGSEFNKKLASIPDIKLGAGCGKDEVKVRLKATGNGKHEFRGQSKSILPSVFHKTRHKQEHKLAENILGENALVKNAKTYVADSASKVDLIKQEINKKNIEITQLATKSHELSERMDNIDRSLNEYEKRISKTAEGLVALFGMNAGAREINKALRFPDQKNNLSHAVNNCQKEWNANHKNSNRVLFTHETKKLTEEALLSFKNEPNKLVDLMFQGAKKENTGKFYRGTLLEKGGVLDRAEQGQVFSNQFIMSCDTSSKTAAKFSTSKYHPSQHAENQGKTPAMYVLRGRPYNLNAGEFGEDERNFKPNSLFELVRKDIKNGIPYFTFTQQRDSNAPKNVQKLYR